MKKQHRHKIAGFFGGILLLFLVAVGLPRVMLPAEHFLLDSVGRALLGFDLFRAAASPVSLRDRDGAFIVGKRSDEFQEIFLINVALPESTPVKSGNTLVGFVISAGDSFSKVRSVTTAGSTVDGVLERSGIPVVLEGRGAGVFEVRLPRGSDVREGDVVIFQAVRPLILGTVAAINDIPSDPYQTVVISHPVNMTTLFEVEPVQ